MVIQGELLQLRVLRAQLAKQFTQLLLHTPQVLAQTRERLLETGARWLELPTLWDVDEPADWLRWVSLQGGVARSVA